jgi:N-acetylmuramoyl-L-alanine amidase
MNGVTPTVCIDGGHGGHDSGAMGPTGLREADAVLSVALMMGAILQPQCHVIYTRQTDVFLSLTERAQIANRQGADVFVAIHANAGPKGQGTGFEVWTYPGQTASDWLATDLFDAYAAEFPTLVKRMDLSDGDIDKESKFTVLQKTNMAAALFELEFIHTIDGEAWLMDPNNRQRAAEALARGVAKYLKLGTSLVTPPAAVPVDEILLPYQAAWVTPRGGERKLVEIEIMGKIDRIGTRFAEELHEVRTEVEALFKKL